MDDFINQTFKFLTGTEYFSDEISKEMVTSLHEKGYRVIPHSKLSYSKIGLAHLQTSNQFALNRQGDMAHFYFNSPIDNKNKELLRFSFSTKKIPPCIHLIQQVRQVELLRYFALEVKKYTGASWGKTFMALEIMEKIKAGQVTDKSRWPELLRRYDSLLEKVKKEVAIVGLPLEKLQAMRQVLLIDGMSQYWRYQTTIVDFLSGKGGNCVLRTVIFLSLIKDLKIPMPQNYQLGAETFKDHIQAVIVDLKAQSSKDLVYAETSTPLENPIYSPEFILRNAILKNSSYFFEKDEYAIPFENIKDLLFAPPTLNAGIKPDITEEENKSQSRSRNKRQEERVDILDTEKLIFTNKFNEGSGSRPAQEFADESYLTGKDQSLLKDDEDENNVQAKLGQGSSTYKDITKPYFTETEVNNSSLNAKDKQAYLAMIRRGSFTREDISTYGFQHIARFLPVALSSKHTQSVLPPIKLSPTNYTAEANSRSTNDNFLWFIHKDIEGQIKEFALSNTISQVYIRLIERHIFELENGFTVIQNYRQLIASANISLSFLLEHSILIDKVMTFNSLLQKQFCFEGLFFQDIECKAFHRHMDTSIDEAVVYESNKDYISIIEEIYKSFVKNPHETLVYLDSLSQTQLVQLFSKLNSFLQQVGYLALYGERERYTSATEALITWRKQGEFAHNILQYVLKNKKYHYSSSLQLLSPNEEEAAIPLQVRPKLPEIDLPMIKLEKDVCANANNEGYVYKGFLAIDCMTDKEQKNISQKSLERREPYPLKPYVLLSLISNSYMHDLNPVEMLLLYYLWTPEHMELAEKEINMEQPLNLSYFPEVVRGRLKMIRPSVMVNWTGYNKAEIESSIALKKCFKTIGNSEYRKCISNYNFNKQQRTDFSRPQWVVQNPYLVKLYEHFLANAGEEFGVSYRTIVWRPISYDVVFIYNEESLNEDVQNLSNMIWPYQEVTEEGEFYAGFSPFSGILLSPQLNFYYNEAIYFRSLVIVLPTPPPTSTTVEEAMNLTIDESSVLIIEKPTNIDPEPYLKKWEKIKPLEKQLSTFFL